MTSDTMSDQKQQQAAGTPVQEDTVEEYILNRQDAIAEAQKTEPALLQLVDFCANDPGPIPPAGELLAVQVEAWPPAPPGVETAGPAPPAPRKALPAGRRPPAPPPAQVQAAEPPPARQQSGPSLDTLGNPLVDVPCPNRLGRERAWTAEETQRLLQERALGTPFKAIGEILWGRSDSSVRGRYKLLKERGHPLGQQLGLW